MLSLNDNQYINIQTNPKLLNYLDNDYFPSNVSAGTLRIF